MATVRTTVQIQSDLIASIYENTLEQITGQALQDRLTDMAVSYINRVTDKPYLGIREFTTRGYDYLEGVIYLGIIYQCTNVLGHTGAWNAANFTGISGTSSATLAETLVNGNATLGKDIILSDGDVIFKAAPTSGSSYLLLGDGTVATLEVTDDTDIFSKVDLTTLKASLYFANATNNGEVLINNSVTELIHSVKIKFDAPVYNFNQLTASTVPYLDASKNLISSAVTPTQLSYLDATSSIQAQLDAKLSTISGISAGGDLSGTYPNPTVAKFNGQLPAYYLLTTNITEGTKLFYTDARVRAADLSGLSVTGGSISSTDTTLQAFGKLQNQINGVLGGAVYQGVWNATTNSPTLTSSTGTKGYYYVVSVSGSTNLDGTTDWKVGDWAIFNGTTWDKVDNTDAVSSVNSAIGAVSLTGTSNRITVTGTVWDISSSYVGQSSITTLGTIGTGAWQGTVIGPAYGGTGVANNAASTWAVSGNFATTVTVTATTGVTLPTSGTIFSDKANSITSAQLISAVTDETGTGVLVFSTSPTLTTPNLGTPSTLVGTNITGTGASFTAGTVTTNANLTGDVTSVGNAATVVSANNILCGYATTATAAGTTTLTVTSKFQQFFTGSTTQTLVLPVASTLTLGQQYYVVNISSGVLTVNSSGGNLVQSMAATSSCVITCILTSGTNAASWSVDYNSNTTGYTFSTGLTNTTGTITNNLSVGVSGGQTAIGGTGVGDALTLKATTANGTSTAAGIIGNVGNNGATTNFSAYNDGQFIIGTQTRMGGSLGLFRVALNSTSVDLGSITTGSSGIWMGLALATSPSSTNYTISNDNTNTILRGVGRVKLQTGSSVILNIQGTGNELIWTPVASASTTAWTYTQPANTTMTAGTELVHVNWNMSSVNQFASNTLVAKQRAWVITAPTYSFQTTGGAITNAVTFEVNGPPVQGTNWNSGTPNLWTARFLNGNTAIGGSMIVGVAAGTTAPTRVLDVAGDLGLTTAGNGIYIKEGSNATMGVATLSSGTVTVNTTKVTANSRIFLTIQSLGTVSVATDVAVTARSAGTSFTITSASITDTSVIAWIIIEPN